MNINPEALPSQTLMLFNTLSSSAEMAATGAMLMGGTALALLLNHRVSEDLDFFYFEEKLPMALNGLITTLKKRHFVQSTLTPAQISQARINGYNIEDYIREYLIDDVKISFSVMNKGGGGRSHYFKNAETIEYQGAFKILGLAGLFKSKSLVLSDRVKSRDLFDLMVLIRDFNFTLKQLIDAVMTIDNKDRLQANAVLEVLIGNVPLDKDDPGFNSIGLDIKMSEIYHFFKVEVDKYEQAIVKAEL